MMIDIAEGYKSDYTQANQADHFIHKEQQTIMFACNCSGMTGLLSKNQKKN
jgi:hypothetical protein